MSRNSKASLGDMVQAVLDTPIPGAPCIVLHSAEGELCEIELLQQPRSLRPPSSSGASTAQQLLSSYFADGMFVMPYIKPPTGTPFQRRVWRQLQRIPPGQTRSYGEIARLLHSSARAVAGACRANPLPILIPCHRVVAAHGLGGYMGQTGGAGVAIKRWLLHHEGHV